MATGHERPPGGWGCSCQDPVCWDLALGDTHLPVPWTGAGLRPGDSPCPSPACTCICIVGLVALGYAMRMSWLSKDLAGDPGSAGSLSAVSMAAMPLAGCHLGTASSPPAPRPRHGYLQGVSARALVVALVSAGPATRQAFLLAWASSAASARRQGSQCLGDGSAGSPAGPPHDLGKLPFIVLRHVLRFARPARYAVLAGGRDAGVLHRWRWEPAPATGGTAHLLSGFTAQLHAGFIYGCRFAGDLFVTASRDHTAAVCRLSRGSGVEGWEESVDLVSTLHGHTHWVYACCALGRPTWAKAVPPLEVVTGSEDGSLRVWDAVSGSCRAVLSGHAGSVFCVEPLPCNAGTPQCTRLASGSADQTIRIWRRTACDEPPGMQDSRDEEIWECEAILTGHLASVYSIAVEPHGCWIASGSRDGTIRIWEPDTTTLAGSATRRTSVAAWRGAQVLHPGKIMAASRCTKRWGPAARDEPFQLGAGRGRHEKWVNALEVSPDGQHLVAAGGDHVLRVWECGPSERSHPKGPWPCIAVLHAHVDYVSSLSFSGDSRFLVSASADKTVRLWRTTPEWRCVQTLRTKTWMQACCIAREEEEEEEG
eukprot:CAMPEP_0118975890 /NCGR_PEP_ID=MMETSP1173-20130426/17161_1 /TAXON_ID=1034831 /ORGANISM="Rhizochromulina marina cf, Strain CCMP1243" /LENGTH=594 /DNA_ID=CAMNT_0006925853 /DNA_START=47 /DNA_END=1831 /DNA_ORIENTATION=+